MSERKSLDIEVRSSLELRLLQAAGNLGLGNRVRLFLNGAPKISEPFLMRFSGRRAGKMLESISALDLTPDMQASRSRLIPSNHRVDDGILAAKQALTERLQSGFAAPEKTVQTEADAPNSLETL